MKLVPRLFALLCIAISSLQAANTYYVSTAANATDSGPGNSATPYKTIQHAVYAAQPGDTIRIRPGTYMEQINCYAWGNPSAWVTIRADDINNKPIIKAVPGSYSVFSVGTMPEPYTLAGGSSASYYSFQYLEIVGNDQAPEANGIQIVNWSNNIKIYNCHIHNVGGGGIATRHNCDYIDIRYNTVENNCWTGQYQASGISFLNQAYHTTSPNYHSYIIGNTVRGNADKRTSTTPVHSDGNGIIIDSNIDTGYQSTVPGYSTPVQISGNVVYDNGGRGIWIFQTSNAVVEDNYVWNNSQDPVLIENPAQIGSDFANNSYFLNNTISTPSETAVPSILIRRSPAAVYVSGNKNSAGQPVYGTFQSN
jgi:parallel beta-helix repeat protein